MTPTVLIVDDDPAIRELVTETLRGEGYDVASAEDGLRALELVREREPDLVLTDIVMPHLGGPELYAQLRRDGYTCSVVLMSAHHQRIDNLATPMINKPFDLDDLIQVVADNISP
jgi:CheY-like chemotaxis protein